jgi:uncharacterized protein YbcI
MAYEVTIKSTTIIKPKPIPKVLESQSLKNRITKHEATIPTDKRMKEIITKTLASACLCCKKLLPTNFWMLSGKPMTAIFAKISEIETKRENVPIISVVVILANNIKKIYPEIIEEIN